MRRITRILGLAGSALLVAQASAQTLTTVKVASGLNNPVDCASPPGDPRLFVCEQNSGDIEIIHPGGAVTKFLDITGIVSVNGERGLLGLAFHPDYANNGRFFINYTRNNGNTRVAEYAVDPSDPDLALPNQVQTIIIINQPFSNHNGGCLRFGPDGMLYVATGDGGSGNDPGNRAQDPQDLLGKMLRFDVDLPAPFIPADNPFVGDPSTLDEIWALGLRNPWRFSFDSLTGDMWIGDVGQNAVEEVHAVSASSVGGENYGWRCMEGNSCTGLSGCTCNSGSLTDPVWDYSQSGNGCSVTGGSVYRGSVASLQGKYICGDYCSGRLWSMDWNGSGNATNVTQIQNQLDPPGGDAINSPTAIVEGGDGEMYIVDHTGEVYMVTTECGVTNYCVASPNSQGFGASILGIGTPSLSGNNFSLQINGSISNQFGLFFFGPSQTQVPAGNGTLCVGGSLTRILPPVQADNFGFVQSQIDFTQSPTNSFSAGETQNFAWWYRDPSVGVGYNFSDGCSVVFCP